MSAEGAVKFVAGIGASAGGRESLERFFRNIPVDSGVAFVVIQHLSADHKSLMAELIARFTSIPVSDARDGEELAPDHIYLLSPGTEVEIRGNRLAVMPRTSDRALAFPIDRMLISLAESYGQFAVAVILSGSGSDGSRGARRVKARGGVVMVEDPTLASFDGMPRSTIDTGSAVIVMSAEALAHALVEHVQTGVLPEGDDLAPLEDIIELLKAKLNAGFDDYKRGTVYRRATRRAKIVGAKSLEGYLQHLESDNDELAALHDDLLIGVTSFFRNPEWFELLRQEIDSIVTNRIEPERELRAWCAGCATGEEAYSIAILFDEAIRRAGLPRTFKVFATDVHPQALAVAGTGVYTSDRLANVSEERLGEYFVRRADGAYQIVTSIRHKIVFAKHDLLRDTPFTNLDVVSCRNMLIYLKLPAQRRALASLSYGLRVGGMLFLGSSESPGDLNAYYDPVSDLARLYCKRVHARVMHRPEINARATRTTGGFTEAGRPETRLLPIYDALLERFMPPAFLVSEQRVLLDSYGGASKLLVMPQRRPTGDFFELIPASARATLAALYLRARRETGPASVASVLWEVTGGETHHFVATAQRVDPHSSEPAYLISLVEDRAPVPATRANVLENAEQTAHLQEELTHARMTLQATVEELEASNEELKATNEELVASNEELHTVNAEHQQKIAELTELNRDIGHLLESIDVATVYLDRDLKIRKFTPRATAIFGLVEHDIGRYLSSFNHQLEYPTLMDDVESVCDGGPRVEKEARGRDGRWYFVRLLPYRVADVIDGVVVTLTDATALAAAKDRARRLSSIVDSSADAIIGMDRDGTISSWNSAATRVYGYAADEMIGHSIMKLVPEGQQAEMRAIIAQIVAGEDHVNIATTRIAKSGAMLDIAKTMSPVRNAQGVVVGLSTFDRDIREQIDLERRLRESERRYEDLYNNAPDMYLAIDTRSGRVLEWNDTFLRRTGYSAEQLRSLYLFDLYPAELQADARESLAALREGQSVHDIALTIRRSEGDEIDVTMGATPIFAPDGTPVGARTVLRDVSARRQAELKLKEAAAMREQFLAMVSHELRGPLHAISAALQIIDRTGVQAEAAARSQATLRRQTRQMVRLVDDLLDVSRITHGKLHLERTPLDLAAVVRSALDAVAHAYHAKGVRLVSEGLDAELPMFGDAGRLEQVFTNLLGNSLRHTAEGRTVHVSCKCESETCDVVVADEGRGIDGKDLRTIFDMFAQSRQGLARTEGGLGLGLTISERIVSAHGGSIEVHSDGIDKGATFTVRLTLDARAAAVAPSPVEKDGALTIVLVEDQDDNREMMTMLLELEGHQVVVAAADGEEGLEAILEHHPRVALLDIGLPGKNGYEVAREVREKLGDSIRLIAMSGYGQPEDIRAAEAAGFDRHLTKPLDQRRLNAALREAAAHDPT